MTTKTEATQLRRYAGAGWIHAATKRDMSELGKAAADLMGDVFLGIYHIDTKQLRQVDWADPSYIVVPINSSLCTVDFDHLTRLMVLAHDRMMRVDIQGKSRGWLSVTITQRATRDGRLWDRCPTLEDHAAALRAAYA